MVVAISIFLLLAALLATRKYLLKPDHGKLKIILALCYVAFIAEVSDSYYAGFAADKSGGTGDTYGWFGGWWILILPALFIAILALHMWLYVAERHKKS